MAAKKFYAVKKGKTTGIFSAWEACRASVEGYSGAEYKGFSTWKEAADYLGADFCGEVSETPEEGDVSYMHALTMQADTEQADAVQALHVDTAKELETYVKEARQKLSSDVLLVYVDGSYQDAIHKYAFGCVFILPEGSVYTAFGNGDNPESLKQRNVTGEMLGAMYAVKTAMKNGFRAIEIRYDYEGIEKWVSGAWRSKTELTGKYARAMREWGGQIAIIFTKVPAHSHVYFNELADSLAKQGLEQGEGVPGLKLFAEMTRYEQK